jgi:hypothetical protein
MNKSKIPRDIPEISDQRLKELSARIRPVFFGSEIRKEKLKVFLKDYATKRGLTTSQAICLAMDISRKQLYVEEFDPRRKVNDADTRKQNLRFLEGSDLDLVPTDIANSLALLRYVRTYHLVSVGCSFAPSTAEVLAQIPKDLETVADAFRTGVAIINAGDGTMSCLTEFYADCIRSPDYMRMRPQPPINLRT